MRETERAFCSENLSSSLECTLASGYSRVLNVSLSVRIENFADKIDDTFFSLLSIVFEWVNQ